MEVSLCNPLKLFLLVRGGRPCPNDWPLPKCVLHLGISLETIAYETETVAAGVAKTGTVTGLTGGANYLGIVVALQASADGLVTQYGAAPARGCLGTSSG